MYLFLIIYLQQAQVFLIHFITYSGDSSKFKEHRMKSFFLILRRKFINCNLLSFKTWIIRHSQLWLQLFLIFIFSKMRTTVTLVCNLEREKFYFLCKHKNNSVNIYEGINQTRKIFLMDRIQNCIENPFKEWLWLPVLKDDVK